MGGKALPALGNVANSLDLRSSNSEYLTEIQHRLMTSFTQEGFAFGGAINATLPLPDDHRTTLDIVGQQSTSACMQTDMEHLNTAVPDNVVAHGWNITRHEAVVMY